MTGTAKRFTVTQQHLRLIRRMWIEWGDTAPVVDQKRPYGNSDIARDVAELAYPQTAPNNYLTTEIRDRCATLHHETATVLQILTAAGELAPGIYELKDEYDATTWQWVREVPEATDPVEVRWAVERLIGEDRVPLDVLQDLLAEYGES